MKPKIWLGLASAGALLTSMVYAGQRLANENAGLINDALDQTNQKIEKLEDNLNIYP